MKRFYLVAAFIIAALVGSSANAGELNDSLKKGTPELKSVGALAFGPEGILFVADPQKATIFALDTQDIKPAGKGAVNVEAIDTKIASLLGTKADGITIADMKVNPTSGNIYLSVMRGDSPIILKVARDGKISEFTLKDVGFSSVAIKNANEKKRTEAITGVAYVNGRLIVSGLSNEEFASNLRMIPFPFDSADNGSAVEIYHGAHGRVETNAPVKSFLAMEIAGKTHVLAGYTCTPLVKFPVEELKTGKKVRGTTIAELGNRNTPLDMIAYMKDGKQFVLIANTSRGVMKVSTEGIETPESISTPVKDTAGLKYETIKELKDVVQLDKLDETHGLILTGKKGAGLTMKSIDLP